MQVAVEKTGSVLRRGFVDVGGGQVHYREAGKPGAPRLVMFHGSPGSSYSLVPLIEALGRHFHVHALDTRGNGDSTALADPEPEIADYAAAHLEAIDALGIERCSLYGFHTGVSIATEIALARPQLVEGLVFEGVSVFDPGEAGDLVGGGHAPDIAPELDGVHLLRAWTMVRDSYLFWPWWRRKAANRRKLGLPSPEFLTGETVEILKSSRTYFRSYRAALRYPKRSRLPLIGHRVLVCANPQDQLFGFLEEAASLIPDAETAILMRPDEEGAFVHEAEAIASFLGAKPA